MGALLISLLLVLGLLIVVALNRDYYHQNDGKCCTDSCIKNYVRVVEKTEREVERVPIVPAIVK
ncbi:MAG: hypothetical protein EBU93_05090 [Chlamydiae bacterium]|nr:hypothetical protein [Chlamydiota bacterium]